LVHAFNTDLGIESYSDVVRRGRHYSVDYFLELHLQQATKVGNDILTKIISCSTSDILDPIEFG